MTRYAISIGSNEGDRLRYLKDAIDELEPVDVSPLYETEPVGGPDQDPFLNAVVVVESDLGPIAFLDLLQKIEHEAGRKRTVRWGPRTLDLDVIGSDAGPYSDERITVPHPRAREREFVLRPLVDIWPECPVGEGLTAFQALDSIGHGGVDLLARDWVAARGWPAPALMLVQFFLFIAGGVAMAGDGELPDGEADVLRIVGAALAMVGLFMAFIASRRLGPAMTANPIPKDNARLIISGPYRYARHPIYGGVILVFLGTSLFLDSFYGVIAVVVLAVFFWLKTGYEERQLRMRFADYQAYRQVVHRRLIPFLV